MPFGADQQQIVMLQQHALEVVPVEEGPQTFHREIGLVHRDDLPEAAQALANLVAATYGARACRGRGSRHLQQL